MTEEATDRTEHEGERRENKRRKNKMVRREEQERERGGEGGQGRVQEEGPGRKVVPMNQSLA